MDIEDFREYCLSLPQAKENQPWTEPRYQMLATYTVGGKWFCIADLDKNSITVKCEPEVVIEMRSRYDGAMPAWHMNKVHWLSIRLESDMPSDIIKKLIYDGYSLIVKSLPKRIKAELGL